MPARIKSEELTKNIQRVMHDRLKSWIEQTARASLSDEMSASESSEVHVSNLSPERRTAT